MSSSVPTTYRHDAKTTYCYYMAEKYSAPVPARNSRDILASDVGSACPIQVSVDIASPLEKNKLIALKYTAKLDAGNKSPDFEFPGKIGRVPVPPALLATSNNGTTTNSPTEEDPTSRTYDVAIANVVICDFRKCDLFAPASETGNYFASSNNPNNFDKGLAVFGSQELIVPKDGKYTGYVHLVVNIAGNSRADFVTFFPVQVGAIAGTDPSSAIVSDSKTTYCWTAKGASVFDERVGEGVMVTVRTGINCPASMKAAVSKKELLVGETFTADWTLQLETATRDPSTVIAELSDTQAVRDPRSGIYSVVPVSVLSACQQNGEKAKCSSYAGPDSTTFTIQEFNNYNLTSGIVSYSTNYSFEQPGEYLVISRVTMQSTDGDRIDMAVYSSVSVTLPASKSGMLFLYVGLGIGALILLLGGMYCYTRKRRAKRAMKEIPFRNPMSTMPPMGGQSYDRNSRYTTGSSSHFRVGSPSSHQDRMFPSAYPQSESSFYTIQGTAPGHYHQQHHRGTTAGRDPYGGGPRRESFDTQQEEGSLDMTIRAPAKFSFQTGYDDESEWEYDTRSLRSDPKFSEFSDSTLDSRKFASQTTDLDSSQTIQVPIMEEGMQMDGLQRSRASSGWTVAI